MSGLGELRGFVVWWIGMWMWMRMRLGFVCLSMCAHVWCCRYGQLGHGAFASYVAHPTLVAPAVTLPGSTASVAANPVISAVSCGTYFTLLVTDAGRLLACGRNKWVHAQHPDGVVMWGNMPPFCVCSVGNRFRGS